MTPLKPVEMASHGHEPNGKGALYLAIIENQHGTFIGKATVKQDGQPKEAWYGYLGHEIFVKEGSVQIVKTPLVECDSPIGEHVLECEKYGKLWYALANTPHGRIPAKANNKSPAYCWYTYAGYECPLFDTSDFVYLCPETQQ